MAWIYCKACGSNHPKNDAYCLKRAPSKIEALARQGGIDVEAFKRDRPSLPSCCMNNDTGCFDEHCACVCTSCERVRSAVKLQEARAILRERIDLKEGK
jgi:hypothetical protein